MAGLLEKNKAENAKELVDLCLKIELLDQVIQTDEILGKRFYQLASIVLYQCGAYVKAYKILRKISTPNDMNNWALLGCILSKHDDPSFYRSYFKRILAKPTMNEVPFIVMLLGNNFLQKQQFDLAGNHYWHLSKSFNHTNSYLNLSLAIVNLCLSYMRTNHDRAQSMKRAVAFLMKYAETRSDKREVCYNLGRALHFLGFAPLAADMYDKVL